MGRLIGCARVNADEQNLQLKLDALNEAGVRGPVRRQGAYNTCKPARLWSRAIRWPFGDRTPWALRAAHGTVMREIT